MKHFINLGLSTLVCIAVALVLLDALYLNNDLRAIIGISTVTGWMALILYSAGHSSELRKV